MSEIHTAGYGDPNQLTALIEPWPGGRAQVMSYSSSHDSLEIWLTKPRDAEWIVGPSRDGGVLLQCVLCDDVRFNPVWGPTKISVSGTSRDSDTKPSLLLTDGDFLVRCWDAQVTGPFNGFNEMSDWANNKTSP